MNFSLSKKLKYSLDKIVNGIGSDNEKIRSDWVRNTLENLPAGESLLDAGAGWLRNKPFCTHLNYKSQDFCQYDGSGDGVGLHSGNWDAGGVDIVCDINKIPVNDNSFDNILCSEVLEHVPDPVATIKELTRILNKGGRLILTAPFSCPVHQAPFYYTAGLSKYWYLYNLKMLGYEIIDIKPNGSFYTLLAQELRRVFFIYKLKNNKRLSVLNYLITSILLIQINKMQKNSIDTSDISCFGYFVIAIKN